MEKLLSLFDFMEYVGQFGFQESFLNSAQCNSRANFFFFFLVEQILKLSMGMP